MPLTYPIATSARTALAAKAHARSLGEAKRTAETDVTLVSDWLRPSSAEYEKFSGRIEEGLRDGYVQLYEGKGGKPVIAVTYWKRSKQAKPKPTKPAEDHTDDLYFSKRAHSRPSARRRRPAVDPRQLDLFVGPDRGGFERPDPQNPKVMIVDEEGTGGSIRSGKDGKGRPGATPAAKTRPDSTKRKK